MATKPPAQPGESTMAWIDRQRCASWLAAGAMLAAGLALAPRPARAGELVADALKSTTLGVDLRMNVYLPDGYKDGSARYPVVYLLHGASGDEHDWTRKGSVVETMDALIKRGLMRPSIAVMPSIGPQSWFADGAVYKMETALITELLPYVEQRYRVGTARSERSIAGLSMGGFGALNLSLKHPQRFCAAGVISPAIYDPLPPETSAARRAPQLMRDGKFDPELWKALNYPTHLEAYAKSPQKVPMWIESGDHDALGIAVMSANLYWRLLKIQPGQAELRIIDGDHEWMVFRDALPDALQYMNRMCGKVG
jgi:enterochelin esterase-like enzyme